VDSSDSNVDIPQIISQPKKQ